MKSIKGQRGWGDSWRKGVVNLKPLFRKILRTESGHISTQGAGEAEDENLPVDSPAECGSRDHDQS